MAVRLAYRARSRGGGHHRLFFRQSRFPQPQSLFPTDVFYQVTIFDPALPRERPRMNHVEGDLSLLARFAVCLWHGLLTSASGRKKVRQIARPG